MVIKTGTATICLRRAAGPAGALLPGALLAFSEGRFASAWTALLGLTVIAGLFDFMSRSRKKNGGPDDAVKEEGRSEAREETGEDEETAPAGGTSPAPKKKGDAPPRPRPRRSDYTGERVSVFVPGRQADGVEKRNGEQPAAGERNKTPATPPADGAKPPATGACPACGKLAETEGQLCTDCAAKNRVTEVANLITSLKAKEVHMLPAERFLFQARSALALSAYKDVERLCAQAEFAAREQEADFEESLRILARCEESIASAIEAGKNTLAAEKALQKATALFKQGIYTGCMEEAVIVPTLIMDRPRPRIIPAGMTPPAGAAARVPRAEEPGKADAPTTPVPPSGPDTSEEQAGRRGSGNPPGSGRENESAAPEGSAAPAMSEPYGEREGLSTAPGNPAKPRGKEPGGGPGEVDSGARGEGGPPEAGMARCLSCGERIDRRLDACPACGRPTAPESTENEPAAPACVKCDEPLEPGWRVCPVCKTPVWEAPKEDAGNCPSCGREVLPAWTICPYCDARLKKEGTAMRVTRGLGRPEKAAPAIPPALREKGVLAQIEEVDRMLDEAARRGFDVKKARNLLELAVTFTRSGNHDKGERYVRKAKNVAETLLSVC